MLALPAFCCGWIIEGAVRTGLMAEPANQPGPGRSTSEAALNDLKKQIAQRNDEAQKAARKIRTAREQEKVAQRRRRDLL
jgi:hypothetical protein